MSDSEGLTRRQRDVLSAVGDFLRSRGMPPTRAELGSALGVSPQTADFHLRALARKGHLRLGRQARDLELVGAEKAPNFRAVPLLGRVAAGNPLSAIENMEDILPVPEGSDADFALRVQGDSMIEAGILDGDQVLVQQQDFANKGEIVVALLGEGDEMEATVKRYLPAKNRVVLRPANATLEDRIVRPGEPFSIAGRVVGVLRLWG